MALARVDRGLQAFIGDAALEAAFGGGDAFGSGDAFVWRALVIAAVSVGVPQPPRSAILRSNKKISPCRGSYELYLYSLESPASRKGLNLKQV
jgi:hypothetical protein